MTLLQATGCKSYFSDPFQKTPTHPLLFYLLLEAGKKVTSLNPERYIWLAAPSVGRDQRSHLPVCAWTVRALFTAFLSNLEAGTFLIWLASGYGKVSKLFRSIAGMPGNARLLAAL